MFFDTLLKSLDGDEIEAVLAHELTHIMNRDVRLLIIAVIFVGIFSLMMRERERKTFRSCFSILILVFFYIYENILCLNKYLFA